LNATRVQYDEKSRYQRLLVGLENTGTQLLHPLGSLQITNDREHLLQSIPLKLNTFLPQTAIDYPVYMQHKALTPGKTYTIKLALAYEGQRALNYTTALTIPLVHKPPLSNTPMDLVLTPTDNGGWLLAWYYIVGGGSLFLAITVFVFIRRYRKHSS
jgi:hypothetical protein